MGLFYHKSSGEEVPGPKSLGERPGFSGPANQLDYGKDHGDTARRHVISSSTLGAAIEASVSKIEDVNGFLARHGGSPVKGNDKAAMLQAKKQAWVIVHNHIGNLWVGPSANNTAIGFIRSSLNATIKLLRSSKEDVLIGQVTSMLSPRGPMGPDAQKEWFLFASLVNQSLSKLVDKEGKVDRSAGIQFLMEASRNADLDIPHKPPDDKYPQRLTQIYAQLIGAIQTGNDIFAPKAALDHFMQLSSGTEFTRRTARTQGQQGLKKDDQSSKMNLSSDDLD